MKSNHGGDIYSRAVEHDFSANINPFGIPERIKRVLCENVDLYANYPDRRCAALKQAIAEREGVDTEHIACGSGASDLIYRLVGAIKPKRAIVLAPTFSEYERALFGAGCETRRVMLKEENGFAVTEEILPEIKDADLMFVCNPNNPTGGVIGSDLMRGIRRVCAKNGILLAVDECFMDFVPDSGKYASEPNEGVVVIKAFTKNYALAGLRLGYALCRDGDLIQKIENAGPCWNVSVPAQLAGAEAARDMAYIEKTARVIEAERNYLTVELEKFGFTVYPSAANFILFRCALPLDKLLLEKKIAVRPCADFTGLDSTYFRTAVRLREENEILVRAIEKIIKER